MHLPQLPNLELLLSTIIIIPPSDCLSPFSFLYMWLGFCCLCARNEIRSVPVPIRCCRDDGFVRDPPGGWANAAAAAATATTIGHHCLYDTVRAVE